MSRGFLMFAHNNEQMDYGQIAICNALMIKSNLRENQVAFVTDEFTLSYLKGTFGEALLNRAFDHIIVEPWERVNDNKVSVRRFQDTLSTSHTLPWFNATRRNAYDLTPFEETVLIDCDYLVADRTLDLVWGSPNPIMINKEARTLEHKLPPEPERFVDPYGIPLYWATCVYFRKSDEAKLLFDLVNHVRENYDFYQFVYNFKGTLYRNDYAFSVAVHMLNGFWAQDGIPSLPQSTILTSFDCDELHDIPAKNEFLFYVNDTTDRWRFTLSRIKGVNIHVMNKFSIIRHAPKIIELYGGNA